MPPELIVRVIGDTSGLEKSFSKAGKEAKQFDRSLTHAVRGAVAGTGAFTHLGRSLAFASGGFVAVAGVTSFLTDSISAARDAQKAQASLAAQMKASGESFRDNKKRVEDAALAYGKFGFENDEVTKSITVLERGTGKISRALALQTTAANLARAKNLDLASAANVLAKVFGGQETALRRAVPGLAKNAHGLDLIREASRKLAGQAAANTTEADRFNAILHNTKEIIGTALLPTLNAYLEKLGSWLDRMNRTGALERDLNSLLQTTSDLFSAIKVVIAPVVGAFQALGKAVGGTKNELELLIAAFVAFKATAKLSAFSSIGATLAGIGSSAAGATTKVSALRLALSRLPSAILVTVGIELLIHRKKVAEDIKAAIEAATTQGAGPVFAAGLQGSKDPFDTRPAVGGRVPPVHFNVPGGPDIVGTAAARATAIRANLPHVSGVGRVNPDLTTQQKLRLALAQHPDDTGLLRQQAAFDQKQIAFLKKLHDQNRISNKTFLTQTESFWNDYNATLDTISSIAQAAASKVAAAAKKAAALRKAQLRANIPAHVSDEAFGNFRFGAVHVPGQVGATASIRGPFTQPILLQLAEAKAAATKSTAEDLSVAKKLRKAAQAALKSGRLTIQGQIDAWNEIKRLNDQITGGVTGEHTKFKHLSGSKLLKELGLEDLGRDSKRKILAGLSQIGPGQTVPTRGGQFTGGGQAIVMHNPRFYGITDMRKFENEVAKRDRSRPVTRRGAR